MQSDEKEMAVMWQVNGKNFKSNSSCKVFFASSLPLQPFLGCHLRFHNFFHAVYFASIFSVSTARLFLSKYHFLK